MADTREADGHLPLSSMLRLGQSMTDSLCEDSAAAMQPVQRLIRAAHAGVLSLGGLTFNVLITYQRLLRAFVTELTGDQPQAAKHD